ncbi:MAG: phage major capsid protein [Deltaproteobacteria bacterium]|nr:phage major capsid protein [Deltaproteobacteria bacterium]
MAGQLWMVNSLGGYLYSPHLSRKLREQAQTLCKFRQFCDIKESFGSQRGDTVNWEKVSNISTAGGVLVETSTIPKHQFNITKGTLSLDEYGNAIPYTQKVKALSEFKIDSVIGQRLRDDQVKVLDSAIEAEFNQCKWRYVATGTAAGSVSGMNGVPVGTCGSQLNSLHARKIIDFMLANNVPYFDGEGYAAILSVDAASGLYSSLEQVMQYTKFPQNGEIGRYYNCRFIRETNSLNNNIGAGGAYGEAYFFGAETVMEAVAVPEELRTMSDDFGRSLAMAWYSILGFKIMWELDPDCRIVKFDSE